MKHRFLFILLLLLGVTNTAWTQELNCTFKVNSNKIQTTDKAIFKNMESALTEFINQRKWTEARFQNNERIDCSMTIVINEMPAENQFKVEIQVGVRRPVYNSGYTTPIFSFRDNAFAFVYNDMQQIEFNDAMIQDNLTAVIGYYIYMIMGFDFDSFALYGGESLFRKAESIVNAAQSLGEVGWKAFESDRNRHALVTAVLDDKMKIFREMYYNYHRLGMDEMSKDVEQARSKITNYLKTLSKIQEINPSSVLLQMFVETKVDEIVNVYSKATPSEKKTIYDLMLQVAPTMSSRLAPLQK